MNREESEKLINRLGVLLMENGHPLFQGIQCNDVLYLYQRIVGAHESSDTKRDTVLKIVQMWLPYSNKVLIKTIEDEEVRRDQYLSEILEEAEWKKRYNPPLQSDGSTSTIQYIEEMQSPAKELFEFLDTLFPVTNNL